MVIGFKDIFKLLGISIVACCAVFVCTLFLNYNFDLIDLKNEILIDEYLIIHYNKYSTFAIIFFNTNFEIRG